MNQFDSNKQDQINESFTPFFSVISLLHGGPSEFLSAFSAGVLSQTFSDFELLLINDDFTPVPSALAAFPRLRIVDVPSCTIGRARNVGMSLARGRYCVFIDSDDRPNSHYLEQMSKEIEIQGYPDALFINDGYGSAAVSTGRLDGLARTKFLLRRFVIWQAAYSLKNLREAGLHFENTSRNEDCLFCLDLLASDSTIAVSEIDNPYLVQKINTSSYTHSVRLSISTMKEFTPLFSRKINAISCEESLPFFADFLFGMATELERPTKKDLRCIFLPPCKADRTAISHAVVRTIKSSLVHFKMRLWYSLIFCHFFWGAAAIAKAWQSRHPPRTI